MGHRTTETNSFTQQSSPDARRQIDEDRSVSIEASNNFKRFFLNVFLANVKSVLLTNRRQFSMVYTLIDHKMTSKNVQNSSGTTSRRRVVSLPSFGHFMASFYGL